MVDHRKHQKYERDKGITPKRFFARKRMIVERKIKRSIARLMRECQIKEAI